MDVNSAILAKTASLPTGLAEQPDAALAGAFAIFDAILANITPTILGADGQHETASPDAVIENLMADDDIGKLIGDADKDAFLPIIENIMSDRVKAATNPTVGIADVNVITDAGIAATNPTVGIADVNVITDAGIVEPALSELMTMLTPPAKREGDNTSGMVPPATALISQHPAATKMFSAAALATSPSGKKDGYASSRSSIHLLASILRKSSKANAETECDSTPTPQSKTIVTQPTVKIPTATTDTELPPEQLASRPGTVANHANPRPAGKTERAGLSLSTVLTPPDLPADEGPTVPTKPAIAESSAHAGTDDDTHSPRNSMQATAFKKTKTMSQNAKRAIEDEPAVDTDAPVIEPTKSNPANAGASTGSTNNPVRGLAGQSILPLPAATASGATLDRSLTTSGQTSQSQNVIDASMGLDQGQNARLFRLSMNDEGWQARLVRGLLDTNNGQGEQKITVLLEPRKLGRMTLQVNVKGNSTAVQIITATADAAALFADGEQRLQQLFDQNGLKLTSLHASTHQGNQQGGQQGASQDHSKAASGSGSSTVAKDTEDDDNPSTSNLENGNNSQVNILA